MLRERESLEVAIHGRGGQGVKTAGDLVAHALFAAGYRVNGQPLYGGERMGAPVMYFLRVNRSGAPIHDRSLVRRPLVMLLFDATVLATAPDLAQSVDREGVLVINTVKATCELPRFAVRRLATLPASRIAKECGLMRGNVPIVSPVMVGAFAGLTGLISLATLERAITTIARDMPHDRLEGNFVGLRRGWESVAALAEA